MKRNNKKGFTLVECVIALAMIELVSLTAIYVFQTTIKATNKQWDAYRVSLLADNIMTCFQASENAADFESHFTSSLVKTHETKEDINDTEEDVFITDESGKIEVNPLAQMLAKPFNKVKINNTEKTVTFYEESDEVAFFTYAADPEQLNEDVATYITGNSKFTYRKETSKTVVTYSKEEGSKATLEYYVDDSTKKLMVKTSYNDGGNGEALYEATAFEQKFIGDGQFLVFTESPYSKAEINWDPLGVKFDIYFTVYDIDTGLPVKKDGKEMKLVVSVSSEVGDGTDDWSKAYYNVDGIKVGYGDFDNLSEKKDYISGMSSFRWYAFPRLLRPTAGIKVFGTNIADNDNSGKFGALKGISSNTYYVPENADAANIYYVLNNINSSNVILYNNASPDNQVVYSYNGTDSYIAGIVTGLPRNLEEVRMYNDKIEFYGDNEDNIFSLNSSEYPDFKTSISSDIYEETGAKTIKVAVTSTSEGNHTTRIKTNDKSVTLEYDGNKKKFAINTIEKYFFDNNQVLYYGDKSFDNYSDGYIYFYVYDTNGNRVMNSTGAYYKYIRVHFCNANLAAYQNGDGSACVGRWYNGEVYYEIDDIRAGYSGKEKMGDFVNYLNSITNPNDNPFKDKNKITAGGEDLCNAENTVKWYSLPSLMTNAFASSVSGGTYTSEIEVHYGSIGSGCITLSNPTADYTRYEVKIGINSVLAKIQVRSNSTVILNADADPKIMFTYTGNAVKTSDTIEIMKVNGYICDEVRNKNTGKNQARKYIIGDQQYEFYYYPSEKLLVDNVEFSDANQTVTFCYGVDMKIKFTYLYMGGNDDGKEGYADAKKSILEGDYHSYYENHVSGEGTEYLELKETYRSVSPLIKDENGRHYLVFGGTKLFSCPDNNTVAVNVTMSEVFPDDGDDTESGLDFIVGQWVSTAYYTYTSGRSALYAKITYSSVTYNSFVEPQVVIWIFNLDNETLPEEGEEPENKTPYITYRKG